MPHVSQVTYICKETAYTSNAKMESVPIAFVDALCAVLKKEDLGKLQQIGRPWYRTAKSHYSRRRELTAHLEVDYDGTHVGIGVQHDFHDPFQDLGTQLSKYDVIRHISMGSMGFTPFSRLPIERFRTKVLPLLNSMANAFDLYTPSRSPKNITDALFSGLHGRALKISTGYLGRRCTEFIERQISLGHLEQLKLHGQQWPESIKASLRSFLRSPNFRKLDLFGSDSDLDLEGSNLTVDLDMLSCLVNRFLKGDLRTGTLLCGARSEEMKDIHRAILFGGFLPHLDGLPEPSEIVRNHLVCTMVWTGPGPQTLFAEFSFEEVVQVYLK
uniref:F-box domain-containing protein n=2 Tax=Steinernema glaseri TaxID=37863 RepID=A0A1I7ZZW8_9BILA